MRESFLASYRCLDNIYRKNSFSGIELNKTLETLPNEEKSLTTKVVYGVLDKNIELNYVLKQSVKSVKPSMLPIFHIGIYCLKFLNIPAPVVVNECVELCKKVGKGGLSGFVNASLKNISGNLENIKYPTDKVELMSVKYSFPLWAVKKLIVDYGTEVAESLMKYEVANNFTHIRINSTKITEQVFEAQLVKFKKEYVKSIKGAFFVKGNLNEIDSKLYTAQSLSSMLVCIAVNPCDNDSIIDVCGAPGGKSVYLYTLAKNLQITCCDLHPHRVELVKKYASRMNAKLDAICNDATVYNAKFANAFDKVLCDAPCSGFGVLSGKPDVKLFKKESDILELAKLQKQILQTSSKYVKVGGTLVYSTCTLFKQENDEVAENFLADNPNFACEKIDVGYGDNEGKFIQFLPYRDHTDGFFIAKFVRKF